MTHARECRQCGKVFVPANGPCACQLAFGLPAATIQEEITAATRKLRQRGGREPADIGLFSDGATQSDLVDRARAGEDQLCVRCLELVPCPCSNSWR